MSCARASESGCIETRPDTFTWFNALCWSRSRTGRTRHAAAAIPHERGHRGLRDLLPSSTRAARSSYAPTRAVQLVRNSLEWRTSSGSARGIGQAIALVVRGHAVARAGARALAGTSRARRSRPHPSGTRTRSRRCWPVAADASRASCAAAVCGYSGMGRKPGRAFYENERTSVLRGRRGSGLLRQSTISGWRDVQTLADVSTSRRAVT